MVGAREQGREGGREERGFEDNGIAREDHCPTLRYALLFSQFRGIAARAVLEGEVHVEGERAEGNVSTRVDDGGGSTSSPSFNVRAAKKLTHAKAERRWRNDDDDDDDEGASARLVFTRARIAINLTAR